jgi:RNA polymerase sigma-70 factor (ECF subfamily)
LDRAQIEQARGGDRDAFEAIVRSRIDAVYRLSLAILGDEADARDATQDTLVAAWRRIATVRDVDRFDAWLGRIAVNAARMTLRRRGRRLIREIPSSDLAFRADPGTGEAVGHADGPRLADALDRLSFDQRAILALHHLEGRGLDEIAVSLAIPVGTVKSRLFTARRALEKALLAEAGR